MSDSEMTSDQTSTSPESEDDAKKRRNQRNIALALMITAFVVVVYGVTILRLGGAVAERSF